MSVLAFNNGDEDKGLTINQLLISKGLKPSIVMIRVNGRIIDRDQYATFVIPSGSNVKAYLFVGGGYFTMPVLEADSGGEHMKDLQAAYFSKHDPDIVTILRKAKVGIAGAGGLGSNVAISLARAGIGSLVIVDYDVVEPSNLNRQQYFVDQIGVPKVEALRDNLLRLNPFSSYEMHQLELNKENIPQIYENVEILVEALDTVEMKILIIETWSKTYPYKPLIVGSGIAGYGGNNDCRTEQIYDQVYVCGDNKSNADIIFPIAPKVALVAALQANLVLELILCNRQF